MHRLFRRRLVVVFALAVLVVMVAVIAALQRDGDDRESVDSPSRGSSSTRPTATEPPTARLAALDTSGKRDMTDALNDALKDAAEGATLVFPAGARYRIDGTVAIAGKHDFTIEGNGAEFFAAEVGAANASQFLIRNSEHVVIRNVVVRGAHPAGGTEGEAYVEEYEHQHGFQVESTSDLELDGVTVTDVYGDFVYLGRDRDERAWSEDIHIHDSVFERNGRQGIALTAARDVVIERNRISDTRRSTIDLEPNVASGGAENVVIRDNDIGPGRLLFVAIGMSRGSVRDVTIEGNKLSGRPLEIIIAGSEHRRPSNISIVDNSSDSTAERTPMKLHLIDGLIVRGNQAPVADGTVPVRTVDCTDAVVEDNDFSS